MIFGGNYFHLQTEIQNAVGETKILMKHAACKILGTGQDGQDGQEGKGHLPEDEYNDKARTGRQGAFPGAEGCANTCLGISVTSLNPWSKYMRNAKLTKMRKMRPSMFKKIDEFHSINEKQTCDFSPCPLDSEVEASHHYTVLPPARLWQCSHPQMGSLKSHVTYLFASFVYAVRLTSSLTTIPSL